MKKIDKNIFRNLPMRNSLRFKFLLLLGGFIVALSSINLLHLDTSKKITEEIHSVEISSLPIYSNIYNLITQFEEVARNLEDAVTTGEKVLLQRAEKGKIKFDKNLKELQQKLPDNLYEEISSLNKVFNNYFDLSLELAKSMLNDNGLDLETIGDEGLKVQTQKATELKEKVREGLNDIFSYSSDQVFSTLRESRFEVTRQLKMSTVIGLMAFLVIFGFLLFLSRKIIVPIRTLSFMTSQVAKGDFESDGVIPLLGDDEVGELARSFQVMKRGLKESTVSKAFVDNIIRSMGDSLIVLDSHFHIQRINKAARKMLKYSSKDILGEHFNLVFAEGDFTSWCQQEDLYNKEEIDKRESVLLTSNGKPIPVLFACSLLKNKEGQKEGYVCVAQDITEIKQAEDELEKRAEELMRSNKELEQFAYVASHDLQEPLRMVSSYLQLLQKRYKGKMGSDADEFIHFAVDGAVRMKGLISDLLTYSRVGRNKEKFKTVNLENVLQVTIKTLKPLIEENNAEVSCDLMPIVMGNEGQLVQLFQNIIGNAIKYRGDRDPKIKVMASEDHGMWKIAISDNGIGMEQEYLDRIFVIFQRLHTKQDYPGTGIGLAICKKIVEKHKGKIWVDSKIGEGSTFFFNLLDDTGNSSIVAKNNSFEEQNT